MRRPSIKFEDGRGGGIKVLGRGSEAGINWWSAPGFMYGIGDNSPALRRFLRRALARLEKEAKPKQKKKRVINGMNRSAEIPL